MLPIPPRRETPKNGCSLLTERGHTRCSSCRTDQRRERRHQAPKASGSRVRQTWRVSGGWGPTHSSGAHTLRPQRAEPSKTRPGAYGRGTEPGRQGHTPRPLSALGWVSESARPEGSFRRLEREDHKSDPGLGNVATPCDPSLKIKNTTGWAHGSVWGPGLHPGAGKGTCGH